MPPPKRSNRGIDTLSSAQDWDRFLSNKYGHCLWEFAHSIIGIFYFKSYKFFYPQKTEFPESLKTSRTDYINVIAARIKKKGNLSQNIYKVLAEDFFDVGWIEKKRKGQEIDLAERNLIDDIYELRPFMKRLRENINLDKRLLDNLKKSHPLSQRSGAPIKNIYQIAFLWSEVMRDEKQRHWKKIASLLNWFKNKLRSAEYSKNIFDLSDIVSDIDEEKLKSEYFRVIKRDKSNERSKRRILQYREHFHELRNIYFPNNSREQYSEIKFSKEFINILNKNGLSPVIVFPDDERFSGFV